LIVVDTPASLTGLLPRRSDGSDTMPKKFYQNEIVKGRVLKSISPEETVLLIKGRKVTARTSVPLQEGAELWLKLEKTSPNLTFKLLGAEPVGSLEINTPVLVSAIKNNIWKTLNDRLSAQARLSAAEDRFVTLMKDLSQTLFSRPSNDMLNTLIDFCGMHWEKKLRNLFLQKRFDRENIVSIADRDLKGSAIMLADLQEDTEWIEKFVSVIKQFQLFNHAAVSRDRKAFLPVPIQFPDGYFSLGQLLIHLPEEKREDGRLGQIEKVPVRITFLLEMSRLGPLRVDLVVVDKEISGRFMLSDESSRIFLKGHIAPLVETLVDQGFIVKQMSCLVKESEAFKETLVEEILPPGVCNMRLLA
jgi:hypothetical protein